MLGEGDVVPRVYKFGGSSLGTAARLRQVVGIVLRERRAGPLALVVSAFGDTTDELLAALAAARAGDRTTPAALVSTLERRARDLVDSVAAAHGAPPPDIGAELALELDPLLALFLAVAETGDDSARARDRIVATGELLSSRVVATLLTSLGARATRVDARSWVVTDDTYGDAVVDVVETRARVAAASGEWFLPDALTVHTGFIGQSRAGRTTTLGRNGSDYTAALLASMAGAGELTLFTDVSGVMTADPGLVREAYPVPKLSYREAMDLTGLGLRMIHPRTVLPLLERGVPLRIRNTMQLEDPGTLIDDRGCDDTHKPACVASLAGMVLVDVEGTLRTLEASIASRVLSALAAARVRYWLAAPAAQGNGVAFVVSASDAARAAEVVTTELRSEIDAGALTTPNVDGPVSLVTLVAEAMGRTVNVAGRFFGAVGAIGVNVKAASQGASSRAITCVVPGADTAATVQAVHAAFNLAVEQVHLLVLGKGTVGGQLLTQIAAQRSELSHRHDVDVRVVGLVDRRASWFDERDGDARRARDGLQASHERASMTSLLARLSRLPVAVLVDCTAADGMDSVYEEALGRGIHVVAANKKPFATETARRDALFAAARRAHRSLRYETTVGASLPVIETLQNLVRTGDRVVSIEGSLSGTLGYLANAVSDGDRLSQAVRTARERGYTEPHPRDDLSGTDAARKALILARELGLALDLESVSVTPFVPPELFAHDDVEDFLRAIALYDDAFERQLAGLRAEGRVLRYLATIEPPDAARGGTTGPAIRVGAVGVPRSHPAARLEGTEALVAFRTDRYRDSPLVVQGAGAGGAVTAAGVLADVLAIARARRRG
jgi:aspartokinase/homoserine dehydrogenase 1